MNPSGINVDRRPLAGHMIWTSDSRRPLSLSSQSFLPPPLSRHSLCRPRCLPSASSSRPTLPLPLVPPSRHYSLSSLLSHPHLACLVPKSASPLPIFGCSAHRLLRASFPTLLTPFPLVSPSASLCHHLSVLMPATRAAHYAYRPRHSHCHCPSSPSACVWKLP